MLKERPNTKQVSADCATLMKPCWPSFPPWPRGAPNMYDKERLDLLKTFGVEGLPALCSRVLFALKSKFVSKQKCETDRRGGEEGGGGRLLPF